MRLSKAFLLASLLSLVTAASALALPAQLGAQTTIAMSVGVVHIMGNGKPQTLKQYAKEAPQAATYIDGYVKMVGAGACKQNLAFLASAYTKWGKDAAKGNEPATSKDAQLTLAISRKITTTCI